MKKGGITLLVSCVLAAALLFLVPIPSIHAVTATRGLRLRVTGNPAPSAFIREQIKQMLRQIYGNGADLSRAEIRPLSPYKKETVTVAIGAGEKTETLPVTVENQATPNLPGTFLLFSDHPEILHENGLLFSAGIIRLRPVRLNFYHQNKPGNPDRAIVIQIENENDTPADLHVIKAIAGPATDIMITGHQATALFLERYRNHVGTILTLPPHAGVVLSRQILKGGDLVTGFLQIEELTGHPLLLSVMATPPNLLPAPAAAVLDSADTHARGAYEIPRLHFHARYVAGETQTSLRLGDLPLENLAPGKPLKGTYGMIWEGEVTIENPYLTGVSVPVSFQPRGGPATATFLLNDTVRTVGYTPPYETVLLATYNLPPQSAKTLHILSMPEGGSSYPILLIVGKPSS